MEDIPDLPKAKRKHITAAYQWREAVTFDFFAKVAEAVNSNPDLFERPTSQTFYQNIALSCPSLKLIPWRWMKNKMCYAKNLYVAACNWKNENGADQKAEDHVRRVCPYFDLLQKVFGDIESVRPKGGDIESSSTSSDFSNLQSVIKLEETSILNSDAAEDADDPIQIQHDRPNNSAIPNTCKEERLSKSPSPEHISSPDSIKLKERKLKLETEKFLWKKEKKKLELQQQFELKKLQIETIDKLEREKLIKQERVQKHELQLKYEFLRDLYKTSS